MNLPKITLWIGVAFLFGAAIIILYALASLYSFFSAADGNVQASIVAGLFALVAAIGSWIFQQRKAELERHKEKKVEVYGKFLKFLNEYQKKGKKEGEEISEAFLQTDEAFDFFWDISRDLVLWASPGVLRAYYEAFKTDTSSLPYGEILGRVDNLYQEIRKDLGLSNRRLKKYDLVGIMVNDIEELRAGNKI